jgi:hypothetical protein
MCVLPRAAKCMRDLVIGTWRGYAAAVPPLDRDLPTDAFRSIGKSLHTLTCI